MTRTAKEKEDKFAELCVARMKKAIKSLRLMSNLANTNNYKYKDGWVDKIMKTLRDEVDSVEAAFLSGTGGDDDFTLDDEPVEVEANEDTLE